MALLALYCSGRIATVFTLYPYIEVRIPGISHCAAAQTTLFLTLQTCQLLSRQNTIRGKLYFSASIWRKVQQKAIECFVKLTGSMLHIDLNVWILVSAVQKWSFRHQWQRTWWKASKVRRHRIGGVIGPGLVKIGWNNYGRVLSNAITSFEPGNKRKTPRMGN